ncbi:MAG: hypothetical protein H6814_05735 [Phycisphaeraceae bacterium]|nr:hypothetical protein [Phycisphaeraceae bacterium]
MNKLTFPALAVAMVAGSAMGATTIKSVEDLATNVLTNRGVGLAALEIGTLNGGESVFGDTANSTDDVNGPSGLGGGGSWNGGDDVYSLQWGGGDITIDLFFSDAAGDLDLILYDSSDATNDIGLSSSVTDDEQIAIAGLAAGKYWIVVDGWQGNSNSYKLAVSPTPGAAAVFGLAGIAAAGRRRR